MEQTKKRSRRRYFPSNTVLGTNAHNFCGNGSLRTHLERHLQISPFSSVWAVRDKNLRKSTDMFSTNTGFKKHQEERRGRRKDYKDRKKCFQQVPKNQVWGRLQGGTLWRELLAGGPQGQRWAAPLTGQMIINELWMWSKVLTGVKQREGRKVSE